MGNFGQNDVAKVLAKHFSFQPLDFCFRKPLKSLTAYLRQFASRKNLKFCEVAYVGFPSLSAVQAVIHGEVSFACGFGAVAAFVGVVVLTAKPKNPKNVKPTERAKTDTFGHADWMPMKEAMRLFDPSREPLGGVVIGEAYRVDQDSSAMGKAFDPRDPST